MTKLPSSHSKIHLRLRSMDVFAAAIAPLVAIFLRDPNIFFREQYSGIVFSLLAFVATLAFFVYFRIGNDIARFFAPSDVQRILKASIAASAMTAAILFVFTRLDGIPRSLPVIHLGVLFLGLIGHRALVRIILGRQWAQPSRGRENLENILVVGAGELAWFYTRAVGSLAFVRQKIVGLIDLERGNRGRTLAGHTILGSCARIDEILTELAVHGVQIERVIVAEPLAGPGSPHWDALRSACDARGVLLDFLPEQLALPGLEDLTETNRTMRETSSQEVDLEPSDLSGNSISRPSERFYFRFRRWLDVIAPAVLIILLLPLFLITGLLVLFSFGSPLLFWQERMGRFGEPIHVHKFRSMRAPFDSQGHPLNDIERETGIGRFLRASRLDELPQLFDILRGDMSFIGPRPLLPIDQPPDPRKRLSVRPGMTGWAQVHGGRIITPVEKGALDEWYIDNANLMVDCKICLLTMRSILKGDTRDGKAVSKALADCGIDGASKHDSVRASEDASVRVETTSPANTSYTHTRKAATSTHETCMER